MNLTKNLPALLPFAAIPLLAFAGRGDKVAFQPSEGVTTTKALTFSTTFYLDDMRMVMNGQELPAEMMSGAMEEGLVINATVDVTDEYVSSKEGKILTLLRSFNKLSLEAGPESGAEMVDKFAELEDSTVSFKWDSEADDYVKTFHESEADETLLENLDVDMDFLALLPRGEVAEGDTWEASGERLGAIFFPGGVPANQDTDDEDAEEMAELMKEELEGQLAEAFKDFVIHCTYAGSRKEGEVAVGVVNFKFDGDTSLDLSDLIQSVIDLQGGDAGIEADITATIGFEFKGEGSLLWDMSGGHVYGFEMSGDISLTANVEGEINAMGESQSMEMSAEVSGEAKWSLETAKAGEEKDE